MYDFALAVAEGFGLDNSLVIPARPESGISEGNQTPASDRLGLDCTNTMSLLRLRQTNLREVIAAMRAAAEGTKRVPELGWRRGLVVRRRNGLGFLEVIFRGGTCPPSP
jgi:hypothetical protein